MPGPGMTNSRVIHDMYQDSSPGVRMTGGAGRKHVLILAVSCPAVISSGALNPPAMAHAEFHLHCHFERRAAEWRNLTPQ